MKLYLLKKLLFVSLLHLFISTSFANPATAQQDLDLVTLTVSSSCASVNVRLSNGDILKTPFSKQFPRGQNVTLEVLDASVPGCGALPVVTHFRRLIVNNVALAKGEMAAPVTLDKDSSVLINYGFNDKPTVILSGRTRCGPSQVRVTENQIEGQAGNLITHFDLTVFRGQPLKLEASPVVWCGGAASVQLWFHHWVVNGKPFPEGQIIVDVAPEKYTLAVPTYTTFVVPWIPVNSFQLLRNGNPVDFIREDDKLKKYTVILNADNFPQGTIVFVDGSETPITRATTTQLEVQLPGKRAKTSGLISVQVIAPSIYFAPVPIEVRKE
jgi:hypothetical protein